MPRYVDARELRGMIDDPQYGLAKTVDLVEQSLADGRAGKSGCMKAEDFSIRDLAEELVGDDWVRGLDRARRRGRRLLEATGAVDTSAFSAITGQIVFSKIKEAYENPAFIWNELCTVVPTTFLNGEKIPGIGGIGDMAENVAEGASYPKVGLTAEYIETQPLVKRGFIVPVTREAIIADRTGILLNVAAKGGEALGFNVEKRVLDAATGVTNTYKRNGTSLNTYLTAGAYVNSVASSGALVDYTDIEALDLLFDAMNDPNTGEALLRNPNNLRLLVPGALYMTAKRIVSATTVEHVDNQTNASTFRTMSGNPLMGNIGVLTSPYIKRRTSSATKWFYGDFKKAFEYRQAWGIETEQYGQGTFEQFHNDIVTQFRASEMGSITAVEPRYVASSNA